MGMNRWQSMPSSPAASVATATTISTLTSAVMESGYDNSTQATTTNESIIYFPEDRVFKAVYLSYLWTALIIGLPGNVLIALVYIAVKQKRTSDWFIFFLSVYDCAVCVFAVPLYLSIETGAWMDTGSDLACKIEQFTIFSAQFSSVSMLGIIAVDRYLKICHPTKRSLNATQARNLGVCMPIFSALVAAPILVWDGNVERRYCRIQEQYKHSVGVRIHLCSTFGFFVCMFFVVIFCYTHVCIVVRRRIRRHKENALKRKHLMQIPAFLQAISNVDDLQNQPANQNQRNKKRFSLFSIGSSRRLSAISPWVKARLSLPSDNCARKLAVPSDQIEVASKESLVDIKRQLDRALMFRAKSSTIEENPRVNAEYFKNIDFHNKEKATMSVQMSSRVSEKNCKEHPGSKDLSSVDSTKYRRQISENIEMSELRKLVQVHQNSLSNDYVTAPERDLFSKAIGNENNVAETPLPLSPKHLDRQQSEDGIVASRKQSYNSNCYIPPMWITTGKSHIRDNDSQQMAPIMQKNESVKNTSGKLNGDEAVAASDAILLVDRKSANVKRNENSISCSPEYVNKVDCFELRENCSTDPPTRLRYEENPKISSTADKKTLINTFPDGSSLYTNEVQELTQNLKYSRFLSNRTPRRGQRHSNRKYLMNNFGSVPHLHSTNCYSQLPATKTGAEFDLKLFHATSDSHINQNNDYVKQNIYPRKASNRRWKISWVRKSAYDPRVSLTTFCAEKFRSEPCIRHAGSDNLLKCPEFCNEYHDSTPCRESAERVNDVKGVKEFVQTDRNKRHTLGARPRAAGQQHRYTKPGLVQQKDYVDENDDNHYDDDGKRALLSRSRKYRFGVFRGEFNASKPKTTGSDAPFHHGCTCTPRSISEPRENAWESSKDETDEKDNLFDTRGSNDASFSCIQDQLVIRDKTSQDLETPLLHSSSPSRLGFRKNSEKHFKQVSSLKRTRRLRFGHMKVPFPRSVSFEFLNKCQSTNQSKDYMPKDREKGNLGSDLFVTDTSAAGIQRGVISDLTGRAVVDESMNCGLYDNNIGDTKVGRTVPVANLTNSSFKTGNSVVEIHSVPTDHAQCSDELLPPPSGNSPRKRVYTCSVLCGELDCRSSHTDGVCDGTSNGRHLIGNLNADVTDICTSAVLLKGNHTDDAAQSYTQTKGCCHMDATVSAQNHAATDVNYQTLGPFSSASPEGNPRADMCPFSDCSNIASISTLPGETSSVCQSARISDKIEKHPPSSPLNDVHVRNSQLNDVNVRNSQLNDVNVRNSQLNDVNVRNSQLNDVNVRNSQLNDVNVRNSQLNELHVRNSQLNELHVRNSHLANYERLHSDTSPESISLVCGETTESVRTRNSFGSFISCSACGQMDATKNCCDQPNSTSCKHKTSTGACTRSAIPVENIDLAQLSDYNSAILEAENSRDLSSPGPRYVGESSASSPKEASGLYKETQARDRGSFAHHDMKSDRTDEADNSLCWRSKDFLRTAPFVDCRPGNRILKRESNILHLRDRSEAELGTDSIIWGNAENEINPTADICNRNSQSKNSAREEWQDSLTENRANICLQAERKALLLAEVSDRLSWPLSGSNRTFSSSSPRENCDNDCLRSGPNNRADIEESSCRINELNETFDSSFRDEYFLISLIDVLPTASIPLLERILAEMERIKMAKLVDRGVISQCLVSNQRKNYSHATGNLRQNISVNATAVVSSPMFHSSSCRSQNLGHRFLWSVYNLFNQSNLFYEPSLTQRPLLLATSFYSFTYSIPAYAINSDPDSDILKSNYAHVVSALRLQLLAEELSEIDSHLIGDANIHNSSPVKCDVIVTNKDSNHSRRFCHCNHYSYTFLGRDTSNICPFCLQPVHVYRFTVSLDSDTGIVPLIQSDTEFFDKWLIRIRPRCRGSKSMAVAQFPDPVYCVCADINCDNVSYTNMDMVLPDYGDFTFKLKQEKCTSVKNSEDSHRQGTQEMFECGSGIDEMNINSDVKPCHTECYYNEYDIDNCSVISRDCSSKISTVNSNQTPRSTKPGSQKTSLHKIDREYATETCSHDSRENESWQELPREGDSDKQLISQEPDESRMDMYLSHTRGTLNDFINLKQNKRATSSARQSDRSGHVDDAYSLEKHLSDSPPSQRPGCRSESCLFVTNKHQKPRFEPSGSIKRALSSVFPFGIRCEGNGSLDVARESRTISSATKTNDRITPRASNSADNTAQDVESNTDSDTNGVNPIETTKAIHSTLLGCLPTFHVEEVHQKSSLSNISVPNNDTCEFFVRTVFDAFFANNSYPFKSDPCLSIRDIDYENSELIEFPLSPLFCKNIPQKREIPQTGNNSTIFHIADRNREKLNSAFDTYDGRVRKITSPKKNGSTQSWFSLDDLSRRRRSSRHTSMIFLNNLRRQLNSVLSPRSIRQLFGVDEPSDGRRSGRRAPTARDTLSANQINVIITRCDSLVLDSRQEMGLPPIRDRAATLDPSSLAKPGRSSLESATFTPDVGQKKESTPKPRASSLDTTYSSNSRSDEPSMLCRSQDLSIGRSRGTSLDLLSPASASIRTGSMCSGLSSMSKLTECSAYTDHSRSDCEKITRRTAEREHNITKLLGVITLMFVISWSVSWSVMLIDTLAVVPVTDMLSTNVALSIARNLFLVNHFCNVVVYAVLSKSFREKLSQCYTTAISCCTS